TTVSCGWRQGYPRAEQLNESGVTPGFSEAIVPGARWRLRLSMSALDGLRTHLNAQGLFSSTRDGQSLSQEHVHACASRYDPDVLSEPTGFASVSDRCPKQGHQSPLATNTVWKPSVDPKIKRQRQSLGARHGYHNHVCTNCLGHRACHDSRLKQVGQFSCRLL